MLGALEWTFLDPFQQTFIENALLKAEMELELSGICLALIPVFFLFNHLGLKIAFFFWQVQVSIPEDLLKPSIFTEMKQEIVPIHGQIKNLNFSIFYKIINTVCLELKKLNKVIFKFNILLKNMIDVGIGGLISKPLDLL